MTLVPDQFDLLGAASAKSVHLVTLGCPKNRVDAELMIGSLRQEGYRVVDDPEEADVLVVNTCAFIESAKEESIDTILELADHKVEGRAERLIVTGCMAQRYGHELAAEMPEVDVFLGTNEFKRISEAVGGALPERTYITYGSALYTSDEERVNSIRGGSAYLKIAEGCNRSCTFCIIPKIRGKQASRSVDDLVREAQLLAAAGVKEVNLIAQDLTSFGVDYGDKDALVRLIERLDRVDGLEWIRLHYMYPWNVSDRLIELFAADNKLVPYVDMPLQHISDRVLKAMRRNVRRDAQRALLAKLRDVPGMVLRTVFITGFPGETEEEFEELMAWASEVAFDRVGVFAYSPEENTDAFGMPDQVPVEVAEARRDALMEQQRLISRAKNAALIGAPMRVLVDGPSEEHPLVFEGRHYGQALDIDGVVYLSFEDGAVPVVPGSFVDVEIDDASDYDLVGVVRAP